MIGLSWIKKAFQGSVLIAVLLLFFSCPQDWEPIGLGEKVDVTPPELTIVAPGNNPMEYKNSNFVISGTVTDDRGVASVSVSWPGGSADAVIEGNTWSANVGMNSISERGQVLFTVVAKDTADKQTSPVYRTVVIDDTAPTVLVKAPQAYGPGPENSNYIEIEGDVWDPSNVKSLNVSIFASDNLTDPVKTVTAADPKNWNVRVYLDEASGFTSGGTYYYQVIAVDNAGNQNTFVYHSSDFWMQWDNLSTGSLFPSMNEIGLWDQNGSSLNLVDSNGDHVFTTSFRNSIRQSIDISRLNLDFIYNADKDIPLISLSNLDAEKAVTDNAIGQSVPLYASATDDKEGINQASVQLQIFNSAAPNPSADTLILTVPGSEFNSPGDGLYTSFEFDLSGDNLLEPGVYQGKIYVEDKKGVGNTASFGFMVDKGAPTIEELIPSSTFAAMDSSGKISLRIVTQDDNENSDLSVQVENAQTNVLLTGIIVTSIEKDLPVDNSGQSFFQSTYTIMIPTPEVTPEEIEVTFYVQDSTGFRSTSSKLYAIDDDLPVVTISGPTDNAVISGNAVSIVGTAADDTSNISRVEVAVVSGAHSTVPDGVVWHVADGNDQWGIATDLSTFSEGAVSVFSRAFDLAGNSGDIESSRFYKDLYSPSLNIASGVSKEYHTSGFTLSGTATDSNALSQIDILVAKDEDSFASITGYPVNITGNNHAWEFPVSVNADGSSDGNYEYIITVTDIVGKTSSLSKSIVVDSTAPELEISNLSNNDVVESSSYTISGLVSDFSGLTKNSNSEQIVTVALDALASQEIAILRSGKWDYPLTSLSEGVHSFEVTAVDVNGLESVVSLNFTVDYTLPETDGNWSGIQYQSAPFSLSGTATDSNGIQSVAVSVTSSNAADAGLGTFVLNGDDGDLSRSWSIPVSPLRDDTYVFDILVTDGAGRTQNFERIVAYDTTDPVLQVVNLTDGDSVSDSTYVIRGTSSDISGVVSVEYSLDNGVSWTAVNGLISWDVTVSGLNEGAGNSIIFKVEDGAGLVNELSPINFGLDLNNPSLAVNNQAALDGSWINADIGIRGTVSDANGIQSLEISTDAGATWTNLGYSSSDSSVINWNATIPVSSDGSDDGTHLVKVRVTDTYNKPSEESFTLHFDASAPYLVIANLVADQLLEVSPYTVNGSAGDNGGSGVSSVEYSHDNVTWTSLSGSTSWDGSITVTEGLAQTILFKAIDILGNESVPVSISYNVDFSLPSTTGNWTGTQYETAPFSLSGTASDTNGIQSVTVAAIGDTATDAGIGGLTVNGINTDTSRTWSVPVAPLNDGLYTYVITITDNAGQTKEFERIVAYDTTVPELLVVNLANGDSVTDTTYVIRGTASDNSGIVSVNYSLDSGTSWSTVSGTIGWEVTVSGLSEGAGNSIIFSAEDGAGLVNELAPISFGLDLNNPSLTVTNQAALDNSWTNSDVGISGTVSDANGIQSLEISTDAGTSWTTVSGVTSTDNTVLNWSSTLTVPVDGSEDGTHRIKVRATDTYNKPTEESFTLHYDASAPVFVIANLVDDQLLTSSPYTVKGSVSDNGGSGVVSVDYSFDESTWNSFTGDSSWSGGISMSDGMDQVVSFRAVDTLGNISSTVTRTVDVSLAKPLTTLIGVGTSFGYVNSDISLSGEASDNNGILSVTGTYSMDGWVTSDNLLIDDSDPSSWSAPALSTEGVYDIRIVVTDGATETTTYERRVGLDKQQPILTVTSPAESELIDSTSAIISGQVSDQGGKGITELQYSRDNANWTDIPISGLNWQVSGQNFSTPVGSENAEGARTLYVRTTDGLNTEVVETINFSYDTTPPSLTEMTLGNSDPVYSSASMVFRGQVSDSNAIASFSVRVNSGSPVPVSIDANGPDDIDGNADDNSWTYTQSNGTDGSFELVFTALDAAGRDTSLTRNVVIDTADPVVAISMPPGGGYVLASSYTAFGSATDANTLSSVQYQLNGTGFNNVSSGTNSWTQNLTSLTEGSYTLDIQATDLAGNIGSDSITFYVDLAKPVLTEDLIGSGIVYKKDSFSLSGDITDSLDVASISVTQSLNGGIATSAFTADYNNSNDTSVSWLVDSLPIGGVVEGLYEYVITATDASGKTSSITRNVTVDNQFPTVEITSLLPILSGNRVNGLINLNATATDTYGLEGVQYFIIDDATVPTYDSPGGTALVSPYNVTLDTTDTGLFTDLEGYTLYVIGRDRAGNDTSDSIGITVEQSSDTPSVSIDSPAAGSQIGLDNRIRGTFSDDDGVATGGAILHIRKVGASSWTEKSLTDISSAGQLVAWNIDVTDVTTAGGDGSYEMYLTVTDDASAKSGVAATTATTATQGFLFDKNAPMVSNSITVSPAQTAYAAGDVLTFSWTAEDFSGLASQTIDVDGTSTGLDAIDDNAPNFQVQYTVPAVGITSGYKTFSLIVEDNVGRSTTRSATFLVDVDAPEVEAAFNVSPAFVGFTPNGAFALQGMASDNRGLASVEIQLSNDNSTFSAWTNAVLSAGNWSYSIADSSSLIPAAGTLYFNVRATDNAGNTSIEQSFTLAVDQSSDEASVSIISPVAASVYGTTVQISGTAKDDDALKGDSVLAADSVEFEYWNTAAPGAVTTVNPSSISGSGKNATFNHSLTLASGTWRVRARATDDGGVTGDWTSDVEFTVNAGAPNLTVDGSVDTYVANANLALSGSVVDSDGIQYVRIRVNGGGWITANAGSGSWGAANVNDTWSYTLALGSDGLKTIEIQTADMSDYIATEQLTTTLDSQAPSGTFDVQFKDNPTGSLIDTSELNDVIQITGTITELNLADTDAIQIRIAEWNGSSEGPEILAYTNVNSTYVWNYVWDTNALTNREYRLQLKIADKAGNVTDTITKVVTTNQDADIPALTQGFVSAPTSADAGNNVLGTLLKISGTLTDDDGFDTGAVGVYLDGSATPVTGTNTSGITATWEHTWGSLDQGEHYITLVAEDRNGETVSVGPTYFLVDTASPTVELTSPAVAAKVMAGTLSITGTAVDLGGLGTGALEIGLRHSNPASSLHGVSYTPTVQPDDSFNQNVTIDSAALDGTLFIDVTLTDRAGKTTPLTRAVTIDITNPSLALSYPSSGAYMNGLVSVTGTADDLNGLADVTFQILDPNDHSLPITSLTRNSATLAAWEFLFNSDSYSSSTYGIDVNGDGKLWKVYFRLAAQDNSGNVAVLMDNADYPHFFIDTDGDKPQVSVTQPKNGEKIGGFINMFGTATDDDGPVMQVEVRIDFNGDGNFTDTRDINNNDGDNNPATGIALGTDTDILGKTVRIGDDAARWEDESAWYVFTATNNSWTLDLNTNNELYGSNTGGTGVINIQVRTRDKFGLASEIIERSVTLDETFPRIENVGPADQSYQNGTFNMTAEFGDDIDLDLSSNSQVRINVNKSGWTSLTSNAGPVPYTLTADFADPQNGWDLIYPVNTDAFFPNTSGILYVDLFVKDEANYQNQKTYTYYVDNQDPSGSWSDRIGAPDGSNLANGMITVNGADRTYIEGNYDDSGAVNGISHIEAYFVNGSSDQVLNIGSSGVWGGSVATESIEVETYDLGTNTWTTGTAPAAVYVTNADLGDSYVMKIDYANEMSSLTFGNDVDNDGYEEFLGIVTGKPRWRSYFDSQNLPDGELELHYVVYDLAGNYVHKMREVFIANNGPQFDRIRIGSDYNFSGTGSTTTGTVADTGEVTEIADYYYPAHPDGAVDRTDAFPVKNNRLYFNIDSGDPNGLNQGIQQIFIEAYDNTGTTLLGQVDTSAVNPASGDYQNTVLIEPGTGFWPTGSYATPGTMKQDYLIKVISRDNDNINVSRWVKIMVYNPLDTSLPEITLNPLSHDDQDSAIGHLELQAGTDPDAWTTITSAHSGNDPKVSGTIVFKGEVTDNNRVTEIAVASENNSDSPLASWSGGQLVSNDSSVFTIDSQVLNENGHTVTFTYKWNSAMVTDKAKLNESLTFDAADGTNSAVDASVTVDVVPYITGITRNNTYLTHRTGSGAYSLLRGEGTNIIKGFNLNTGGSLTIDTNASGAAGTAVPVTGYTVNGDNTEITFSVPAAARSGWLRLVVNNREAVNNLNDDSLASNSESNAFLDYTQYWTDDRYIRIWQANADDSFDQSTNPIYPAMSMGSDGTLYASFSNYSDSMVYYSTLANNSRTRVFRAYDPPEETDISVAGTNTVNIFYSANYHGGGDSNWTTDASDAGGIYLYDNSAPEIGMWISSRWRTSNAYRFELFVHNRMLQQFKNLRVVRGTNNRVHNAYYDRLSNSVKYSNVLDGENINSVDNHELPWINLDGDSDTHDTATYTNGTSVVLTDDRFDGSLTRTTGTAEFLSIAVDEQNLPVVVYLDAVSNELRLARANNADPNTNNEWSVQTILTQASAGVDADPNYGLARDYISAKFDSTGILHIVFRNSRGELCYVKSKADVDNGAAYEFEYSETLDTSGLWADLTLRGTVPFISYMSKVNAYDGIKVAFFDDNLDLDNDGTSEGGWETMTAAMNKKASSVRTSIEAHPNGTGTNWTAAVGYTPGDEYRVVYYIGE